MAGRLAGKVALVTGGGRGIGAGIVELFAAEGAIVAVADISLDNARVVADKIGSSALALSADVTCETDVIAAVTDTIQRFGRIDCLVNNAGIVGAIGPLTDTPLVDWERTLAVHLTGCFLGMKHAGRAMKAQRSGVILSVASTAGILGGLGPHAYTAAKHAIVGLTKSAASEFAHYGVRVNAVAPGATLSSSTLVSLQVTDNPESRKAAAASLAARSPLGLAALPQDVAEALAFLASDAARTITGQTLAVDAGQTTMIVRPDSFSERSSQFAGPPPSVANVTPL
jgi:NAD(P)-dependent dehydrogenase (short-subunit alcohol dehydrogenase family)